MLNNPPAANHNDGARAETVRLWLATLSPFASAIAAVAVAVLNR